MGKSSVVFSEHAIANAGQAKNLNIPSLINQLKTHH